MSTTAVEAPAQGALEQASRRKSLLALGLAAFALGGATAGVTEAKKKGKRCKKKEQRRCSKDTAACKARVAAECPLAPSPVCDAIAKCCNQCSAGGFMSCYLTVPLP